MVLAAASEICSFANKSTPFSVQIDNIWNIGVTDVAFTVNYIPWWVEQWYIDWMYRCRRVQLATLFCFLEDAWRGREHLQYALNIEAQKLHSAIVPPTHVLEFQEFLEKNSEIQYEFRLNYNTTYHCKLFKTSSEFSPVCIHICLYINNVFLLHVPNCKSHNQFISNKPVLLSDIIRLHYISHRNTQALEIILVRKYSISKPCPHRCGYSTFNMLRLVYIKTYSHLCCNDISCPVFQVIWIADLEMTPQHNDHRQ